TLAGTGGARGGGERFVKDVARSPQLQGLGLLPREVELGFHRREHAAFLAFVGHVGPGFVATLLAGSNGALKRPSGRRGSRRPRPPRPRSTPARTRRRSRRGRRGGATGRR